MPITAKQAFYIKLGRGGGWESECLAKARSVFGYRGTPHDLCIAGKWDQVRAFWAERKGHAGTGTSFARQIRTFYETDETALFITFAHGLLYWCRPTGPVEMLADGNRRRATVDGWHSQSVMGTSLTSDRISGHLLKVQMFQGTICRVKPLEYLLRKLNDELSPEVAARRKPSAP